MEALNVEMDSDGKLIEKKEERRAKVFWYHGPGGSGKTWSIKKRIIELCNSGECSLETITKIDEIQNGFVIGDIAENTEVLWIDDFRGSDMPYNRLLKLLDGRNVSVKGSHRYIAAKYIFISSPMSPKDCYCNLSSKDGIYQLERRIEQIIDLTPETEPEWDPI